MTLNESRENLHNREGQTDSKHVDNIILLELKEAFDVNLNLEGPFIRRGQRCLQGDFYT